VSDEPHAHALRRSDGRPLIIVHGGSEPQRYRNVLEALDTALALGADYFEFDIRRTADAVLVVHHDEEITRSKLRELSYADAERAAAALGYALPRLETVLRRAGGAIRLDVELKEAGYEDAVLQALQFEGIDLRRVVVTSFEQPALDAIHTLDGDVVTGLLVWDVTGAEALDLFRRSGTAFLGPDHAILDEEMLREADRRGVTLVPWTVNDPIVMDRLLRAPAVAGLITDEPAKAFTVRGHHRKEV
jgi:glycerophosphoryl diester phosphodiesterase